MADKQSFYDGICENTQYDESFFKKVYGYSVYDAGFLMKVTERLMDLGHDRAIRGYSEWFGKWQKGRRQELKGAAAHMIAESKRRYEEKRKKYEMEGESEKWKKKEPKDLQQMSDRQLLTLLEQLKKENRI